MTTLNTAIDLGESGVDVRFGWELLSLAHTICGPDQLFDDRQVTLDAVRGGWSVRDVWSNDIHAGGMFGEAGNGALQLSGDNCFAGVMVGADELALTGRNRLSVASEARDRRLVVDGMLEGLGLRVARAGESGGSGVTVVPTQIDGALAADRLTGTPSFTCSFELSSSNTTRMALGGQPLTRLDGVAALVRLSGRLQLTVADMAEAR